MRLRMAMIVGQFATVVKTAKLEHLIDLRE